MIKSTIIFDHRGRSKGQAEGPLELRLTINRKPYYIATGITVPEKEWKNGKIEKMFGWPELRERLNIIQSRIEEEINKCLDEGRAINPAEIRRVAWVNNNNGEQDFLSWIEEQIPVMKIKLGTRKHYWTMFSRLKDFGRIRSWNDLTVENIYMWDGWLHQIDVKQKDAERKAGKEPRKVSDGAVWNYHKKLKRLLNIAVMFGKIERNPYDRIRGQFERGDRETVDYLTREELAIIENCKPTEGSLMQVIRDMFIFQAYTGLSYSDMQAFDIADYRKENNVWICVNQRIKTGSPYVSELLPPVVAVLERYGMKIPKLNNAKYNVLLKAMGEMLGMQKSLTSHMARHTFATLMLRSGAKIENVSRMLGHKDIKQTQRYAKVMAESIHDDFKNFLKSL